MYENLFRLKIYPSESFASVIERLLQNDTVSLTITYKIKPKLHCVNISVDSKGKLTEIKSRHEYKSLDEALWRVMNNAANRTFSGILRTITPKMKSP